MKLKIEEVWKDKEKTKKKKTAVIVSNGAVPIREKEEEEKSVAEEELSNGAEEVEVVPSKEELPSFAADNGDDALRRCNGNGLALIADSYMDDDEEDGDQEYS